MPDEVLYVEADGVGTITLNRPQARNALTPRSYAQLEGAVRGSTARCLVVTGADPAFCSGDARAVGLDVADLVGHLTGS